MKSIVFFDGYCHLCQSSVQFILKRDKKARFYFAPLNSTAAKKYLQAYPHLKENNTLVLWQNEKAYDRSRAALKIVGQLCFPWPFLQIFYMVPKFLADRLYNWVARHRYRWFGKSSTCFFPKEEWKARFLN